MTVRFLAACGLLLFMVRTAPAMEASGELATCQQRFQQALELALYHPDRARLEFRACALQLAAVRSELGQVNGNFEYTLGSTWFLAGDLGQATLALRRAELKMPADRDVQANLALVRGERHDQLPDSFAPEWLMSVTLPWLPYTLPEIIVLIGWGCWWWLMAGGGSRRSPATLSVLRTVTCIACIAGGIPSIARQVLSHYASDGVITVPQVVARTGDALLYPPAFTNPLTAGSEVRLLEQRPNWSHVQLSNGSRCWLPANAITSLTN